MSMFEFLNGKGKKEEKRKVLRTTKDSIPYETAYGDGILESANGEFSKMYSFGDVNFETASSDEQLRIFNNYKELLHSVEEGVKLQIVIHNKKESDKLAFLEKVMYKPLRDGLNEKRNMMNTLISERIAKGTNGLKQNKYIVVSTVNQDPMKAKAVLDALDHQISGTVKRFSPTMESVPLTLEERLHVLFNIYNQDGEGVFENVTSEKTGPYFSMKALYKQGLTTKDAIAPSGMDFSKNRYFTIGNTYGRALYLDKIPVELSTEYLHMLANINCSSLITMIYEPIAQVKAVRKVKNTMTALSAEMSKYTNFDLQNAYDAALDLMEDLVNRKQRAFYVTVCMTVFADTKADLDDYTKQISAATNAKLAPMKTLFARQEDGFNTCLPFAKSRIDEQKFLTTESAAVFLPFTSLELEQLNGLCYGTNKISRNQVFLNRLSGKNANGIILGGPGSGKTAMMKMELFQALLRSKSNYVYIIDPKGDYGKFVEAVGGQMVRIAPGSPDHMNPLDLDLTEQDGVDPLALKCDYVIGLVEIMRHGQELDPTEQSIVSRCTKEIYRGYIEHMADMAKVTTLDRDEEALPTLRNLYNRLLSQPEPEAKRLAASIEVYCTGHAQLFAHRSNIDVHKRVIVYDVSRLGSGSRALGLYICLSDIANKSVKNRKENIWSWVCIDEMQSIMQQSLSATKYLARMWAMFRSMNLVPTGVMQNTTDLVNTAEGRNILSNTNYIFAMGLSQIDRTNIAEFLGLSDAELTYITDPKPGSGLLSAGSTRIPFDNTIDRIKYPELFDIINTSGDEASRREV